jgi:RNA polymerase sigma-54 factor
MRFETSQHMKMGQSMRLAPRMIQSMEILQMPLAELEERIERELESNPTLEIIEREPGDPVEAADAAGRALTELTKRAGLDRLRRNNGERDAKTDAMSAEPARSESLLEQLQHQWSLVEVNAHTRAMGELLLSHLDADGYLRTPLVTIAERASTADHPTTVADLETALKGLQLFLEPAGIAARDVRECLLLQLDAMAESESPPDPIIVSHAHRLVADHLDDLMKNRLPRVAEKTGYSMVEIREAIDLMRRLSLHPGRRLVPDEPSGIVPDAIVEYEPDGDRYLVYLNDARLPNLRVNQEYAKLAKDKNAIDQRGRDFIKTNLSNAQWLMEAVGQRRQTLLRVVERVVEHQRDFFDQGPQALKTLPMSVIADELGVHLATISRAVSEKYIATPRGVWPLRKFFSGGLSTKADAETGEGGGEDMAWEAIKIALREVIDAEDKSKPLSDDALADALKKRGIEIARRTVAKYRDQLSIPPARLRRTF